MTPDIPGSVVVFGILLYSAQQYGDFSGGIDMVEAASSLFGVGMAENFRRPYFSVSLADFWRRWHITLGTWMRDYVFFPFALTKPMQRLGKWASERLGEHLGRTLPACVANILVFLIVGLWHGAEPHYVAWGLYNGVVIALADLGPGLPPRERGAPRGHGWPRPPRLLRGAHLPGGQRGLVLRPHLRLRRQPALPETPSPTLRPSSSSCGLRRWACATLTLSSWSSRQWPAPSSLS